jgi:mRNA interferase YafQ
MREIERSSQFKRDFRRIKETPRHRKDLEELLSSVLTRLVIDASLSANNRDHALAGDWHGYRECHLKPDLLLIYSKPGPNTLRLARLGSHSELFS